MDWDLCKTFVMVAETGSFMGAARRLRTSHQTVSREIAALETQLGTKLLARTAGGLVLTPDGHSFRPHAEGMAAAALQAETAAAAGGRKARGTVKLSIGATLASHWLMPHLTDFLDAHDQVQLEIITYPYPASVRKREADIVLRPVDSGEENLVGRRIARLGTGLYASRRYLARRPMPEKAVDWKQHHIIGFADPAAHPQLARWSASVTRQGTVVMRCSSQGDMLVAACAGIGISALACFVAESHPDLVRVAPQKAATVADLWLLAHPDLVQLPAVRAVIDFIAATARADQRRLRGWGT